MIGDDLYPENPTIGFDTAYDDVVSLWRAYQGSQFGIGYLPDSGGVNDQASWLMDAFSYMTAFERTLPK